jgi:hypothetical protein
MIGRDHLIKAEIMEKRSWPLSSRPIIAPPS